MSPFSYTEDTLVQQTTADYLEQQLGWQSVYAYNNEDFGPDSLLGRASDRAAVLTRPLREKLVALNPGLPDAAYDDAVRQSDDFSDSFNFDQYVRLTLTDKIQSGSLLGVRF